MSITVILVPLLVAGFQSAQAQETRLDPRAAIAALNAAREDLPRGSFAIAVEDFISGVDAATVAKGLGAVARESREIATCTRPTDPGPRRCSMKDGLVGAVRLSRIVSASKDSITVRVQSVVPFVTEYRSVLHHREYAVALRRASDGKWTVVSKKLMLES